MRTLLQIGKGLGGKTSKGIIEYYLKSPLLRSLHVRLQVDVSCDPTIFEKAMLRMSCTEICTAFSIDVIHDSNLFLMLSNIST